MSRTLKPGSPLPKGMRWRGGRIEVAAFLHKGAGGRPTRMFSAVELDDARDWQAEAVRAYRRRRLKVATGVTVLDYATGWVDLRAERWALNTTANARSMLANYVEPSWLAPMPVADVLPQHIDDFIAGLVRADGEPLGAGGKRNVHGLLRQVFAHAERNGIREGNPAVGCETLPPAPPQRHVTLTREEFDDRLLPACRADYRTLLRFLAYSGLRWGEATGLRVCDVLPLTSAVRVHEQITGHRGEDGERVRTATKTHVAREHPLMPALMVDVQAHIREHGLELDGLLFTSPRGLALQGSFFAKQVLRPALAKAKLDVRMRVHDLRHCCATWLFDEGFSTQEVAAYLGHSSDQVTKRVYIDVLPSRTKIMAERLFRSRSEEGSVTTALGTPG